jgi:hypothetical protein
MNTYRHLFGFLIGPTLSSSPKQGLFFSLDCSYYYSNHTSRHVFVIGNQSLGVSQDKLNDDGVNSHVIV